MGWITTCLSGPRLILTVPLTYACDHTCAVSIFNFLTTGRAQHHIIWLCIANNRIIHRCRFKPTSLAQTTWALFWQQPELHNPLSTRLPRVMTSTSTQRRSWWANIHHRIIIRWLPRLTHSVSISPSAEPTRRENILHGPSWNFSYQFSQWKKTWVGGIGSVCVFWYLWLSEKFKLVGPVALLDKFVYAAHAGKEIVRICVLECGFNFNKGQKLPSLYLTSTLCV